MPLVTWLGLLFGASVAFGGASAPRTTVTLAVCDVQALPLDEAALRGEAESVLAGAGLALRWRTITPGVGTQDEAGAIPVRLLSTSHGSPRGQRVLGMVLRERREPSPIWVFVDDVRELIAGRARAGLMDASERRRLSVALGRIVAHEVVHALAPAQPHSAAGLMSRAVNHRLLEAPGVGLDPVSANALRAALRQGLVATPVGLPGLLAGH